MDRRTFLKALAGGLAALWGAVVIVPIFKYLKRPKDPVDTSGEVVVGKASDIPNGGSKTFKLANKPGLLIRDSQEAFSAVNATCTHLACTVQYRDDKKDIYCACHNGIYNVKGGNVSGPPPKPLQQYKVTVNAADDVVVSLV